MGEDKVCIIIHYKEVIRYVPAMYLSNIKPVVFEHTQVLSSYNSNMTSVK